MKKQILISSFVMAGLSLAAQTIPNAGFETWVNNNESSHTYSMPQNWLTIDIAQTVFMADSSYVVNSVVPAATAHSGNSAVRLQTAVSTQNDTVGGIIYSANSFADMIPLFSGTGMSGFQINSRPANLTGYYRMNITGDDYGVAAAILTRWNTATQTRDTLFYTESLFFTINQSAWTSFSFPISYSSWLTPDTCLLAFGLVSVNNSTDINSFLEIDDVAFSGTAPIGIDEQNQMTAGNFYPNPMNTHAQIRIEGAILDNASLEVYDLSGKLVRTDAGINGNLIEFERNGLASGSYFYRVMQDGTILAQGKMMITE